LAYKVTMTQSQIIYRGKTLLFLCLAALVLAMALSDWHWSSLLLDRTRTTLRYTATIGLGLMALYGSTWAKQLLAGLVAAGVMYAIYGVAQLGSVVPALSVWMIAHALINAVVAGVLLLSPSIARYQSSKSELVMP
jgi:hypothetical protein